MRRRVRVCIWLRRKTFILRNLYMAKQKTEGTSWYVCTERMSITMSWNETVGCNECNYTKNFILFVKSGQYKKMHKTKLFQYVSPEHHNKFTTRKFNRCPQLPCGIPTTFSNRTEIIKEFLQNVTDTHTYRRNCSHNATAVSRNPLCKRKQYYKFNRMTAFMRTRGQDDFLSDDTGDETRNSRIETTIYRMEMPFNEVKEAVNMWFKSQEGTSFYDEGMQRLEPRVKKCLNNDVHCVGK